MFERHPTKEAAPSTMLLELEKTECNRCDICDVITIRRKGWEYEV